MNGKELFHKLRELKDIPVIFLSNKSEDVDRILGLEIGADDYVTKPFNTRELVARVRAVLRRIGDGESERALGSKGSISHGKLQIIPSRRQVTYAGHELELTKKQFDLLYVLAQRPGKVFSRDELIDRAYDDSIVSHATIDSHICRLRSELANYRSEERDELIRTVRGGGFTLADR